MNSLVDAATLAAAADPVAAADVAPGWTNRFATLGPDFYTELAPYGSWYDDRTYGYVFAPSIPNYTPYSNGHWKNTEYGFTWVSGDPFGWATDHYGRWVWVNRWVWAPDTTWGPAWVQWRVGAGWAGWAPLGYTDDAYVPDDQWRFVPAAKLTVRDIKVHFATASHHTYVKNTAPVRRYNKFKKATTTSGSAMST